MAEEKDSTEELERAQAERERAERDQAAAADEEPETRTHERRADKAAYLRDKLEERKRSEEERG